MDKSNIPLFNFIKQVTNSFYEVAKKDIIIGYHFRHIENFDNHLPKIYQFWVQQLLTLSKKERDKLITKKYVTNIFKKHSYLKIKKGEVGRWVLLFQQSIENNYQLNSNNSELESLKDLWIKKTEYFHKKFLESSELFPKNLK